ncbi:MAG: glycoside hydrolase family 36 protein [Rikenellaceae bacterium]
MKKLITLFIGTMCALSIYAQERIIILDNGSLQRKIAISNTGVSSTSLLLKGRDENFINRSREFFFTINEREYNGLQEWSVEDINSTTSKVGVNHTQIILAEKSATPAFRITLNYALYPGLPLCRKWIDFENIGSQDIKIENLNIEDLDSRLYSVHSVVYNNYARMKHLMKYEGDWDDAVAVVHEVTSRSGIALGNEAMSVLKRTAYHTTANNIEIGLTHKDSDYPFRKWLRPNEKWSSPKTFICLYNNTDDGFSVINNDVNKFVTNFMGNKVIERKTKPTFVYNTWYPFKSFIDDKLVRETAKAAAECGIQEYVIDDGWQYNENRESAKKGAGQNYGDWLVDLNKFPDGLKPTFDYIKSLGMKPGLWITLASANTDSNVYKNHPEWFVEGKDGDYVNLHTPGNNTLRTASFGTGWVDYIKGVILRLVKEYGLEYAKLDLAVVTSAYYNDIEHTGSYATNHPQYRDQAESFIVFYENLLKLFDELHEEAPDLFIDCTFETAGKTQLMDYAISKHAEGNWLSNFVGNAPYGSLRVRQMAWWRSPALPASSLVIGNMAMDDPNFELTLKSLIGTLPIVLGDPRKLSSSEKKDIRKWSDWMKTMQNKHDYMNFRKDLRGFGEPKEGYWDGWQRLNFNTNKGGIFGVFKQGAIDDKRLVVLDDLNPQTTYLIKKAPTNQIIYKSSGKDLMNKGFEVNLSKEFDGDIFEVCEE